MEAARVVAADVSRREHHAVGPEECAGYPARQHDPNRPKDVLKVDADEEGVGGDDAAGALRYLVATNPRESK